MADKSNERSQGFWLLGRDGVTRLIKLLVVLLAVSIALIVIVGLVPGAAGGGEPAIELDEAEHVEEPARESGSLVGMMSDGEWEARNEWISTEERAKLVAKHKVRTAGQENENKAQPESRIRKVRRYVWESPAETRGKLWNIPEGEGDEQTLTAFLRVCISEADGYYHDCIGIWQVIKNIRRSKCERGHVRRITECEEYTKRDGTQGLRETYLSVMKRASKSVLGVVPPRSARSRWVSELELDCKQPPSWPANENQWDSQYGSKRCPRVVELGRYLIKNELPPRRPGVSFQWLPGRPITWGGRCENKRGACDDRIACSRGLARVEQDLTHNAFWCRPGTPGCRRDADPICQQLGYGHLVVNKNEEPDTQEEAQTPEKQLEEDREETQAQDEPVAVSEPEEGCIDEQS